MSIEDARLAQYPFLAEMIQDTYFPKFLVEKGQKILVTLCEEIETKRPADDAALFELTHAAVERFNELAEEFYDHDSEIETAAREAIARDVMFILDVYDYDVDIEDAIANRDW